MCQESNGKEKIIRWTKAKTVIRINAYKDSQAWIRKQSINKASEPHGYPRWFY